MANEVNHMRDYQRKKNNKYILPHAVYHKTLWQIRDYYRLKEEAEDILLETPSLLDSAVHSSDPGDPTYSKASRREGFLRIIQVIDTEKAKIPQEYQKGVWDSVMYGTRYPDDADRHTYGRHKARFVYGVAVSLGFIK